MYKNEIECIYKKVKYYKVIVKNKKNIYMYKVKYVIK